MGKKWSLPDVGLGTWAKRTQAECVWGPCSDGKEQLEGAFEGFYAVEQSSVGRGERGGRSDRRIEEG